MKIESTNRLHISLLVAPNLAVWLLTLWRRHGIYGIFISPSTFDALLQQDIDLDHYEMKEEEPVDGKKSEDDGIEKENLAILEKIRKNQRQDHLNVSSYLSFENNQQW